MATQRLSTGPLQWSAQRKPRWLIIGFVLVLHVVVLSTVLYFNATTMIPIPAPIAVDVISEPAPQTPASAVPP